MNFHRPCVQSDWRKGGFSLTELLLVMALMAMMAGLVVPAFQQIGSAGALTASGNQIANLVNFARSQSLARDAMTALVVATDSSLEQAHRAVAVFELQPRQDGQAAQTSAWHQISKWETLRNGVIIDPSLTLNNVTDTAGTPGVPSPVLPAIQIAGRPVNAFRYLVFLPGGSLLNGKSKSLKLLEGYFPPNSDTPVYTHRAGSNSYSITVLAATGRSIITRQ